DAGVGGIGRRALPLDAVKARAAATAGAPARDADIARDGTEGVGGAVELLAVGGAARGVATVEGRRLERPELAGEAPDSCGGDAGERLRPLRSLHDAVGEAEQIGAIRG